MDTNGVFLLVPLGNSIHFGDVVEILFQSSKPLKGKCAIIGIASNKYDKLKMSLRIKSILFSLSLFMSLLSLSLFHTSWVSHSELNFG